MADEVDVIISAFATPPRGAQYQPLAGFKRKTVLVQVPFQLQAGEVFVTNAFHRAADKLRNHEGYILPNLLKRVKGKIRSVALVSFSGGTGFTADVLRGPDAPHIDTVMVLDGIHLAKNWQGAVIPEAAAPWLDYARGAVIGTNMLLVAHTNIAAPQKTVTSTTESSRFLWEQLQRMEILPDKRLVLPRSEVVATSLEAAASSFLPLRLKIRDNEQTYTALGIRDVAKLGNALSIDVGGVRNIDHEFVSKVVQGAFFKAILQPRWAGDAVACLRATSGLGQTEECLRRLVTAPARYQIKDLSTVNPGAALILGGVGAVAGYYLARRL